MLALLETSLEVRDSKYLENAEGTRNRKTSAPLGQVQSKNGKCCLSFLDRTSGWGTESPPVSDNSDPKKNHHLLRKKQPALVGWFSQRHSFETGFLAFCPRKGKIEAVPNVGWAKSGPLEMAHSHFPWTVDLGACLPSTFLAPALFRGKLQESLDVFHPSQKLKARLANL